MKDDSAALHLDTKQGQAVSRMVTFPEGLNLDSHPDNLRVTRAWRQGPHQRLVRTLNLSKNNLAYLHIAGSGTTL